MSILHVRPINLLGLNIFSNIWLVLSFFFFLIFPKNDHWGQGPGGIWCDVDVVEFSYYGAPAATPKEEVYTELVDGLRGSDPTIGSGSQVIFLFHHFQK